MIGEYLERLTVGISLLPTEEIQRLAQSLSSLRANGGSLWICGNGGSAATAQHMEVDLVFGVKSPIRAIALSSNAAGLTATGNDVGFQEIFSRQLEAHARPDDLLLVISASGNSPNLITAVECAKSKGLTTAGLLGFDGGQLSRKVDLPIVTKTAIGDYGVAEDLHAITNHIIKELLNSSEF